MLHIIKGNIIFPINSQEVATLKNGYVIYDYGKVIGTFSELPEQYNDEDIVDYGNKLIIPGFNDMHLCASQTNITGFGMELPLTKWLNDKVYPEELKFQDIYHANETYRKLVIDLWKNGTTRIVATCSSNLKSTSLFMELLQSAGIGGRVGLSYMDKNCPEGLKTSTAIIDNNYEKLLNRFLPHGFVAPIITPRFIRNCSTPLLDKLSTISDNYKLPASVIVDNNIADKEAFLDEKDKDLSIVKMYHNHKMIGHQPSLMAYSYHISDDDMKIASENNIKIVHCPTSNINLSNCTSSARKYINNGIDIVLGSAYGSGHTLSMIEVMRNAIQVSRIHAAHFDDSITPLSYKEVFYMATEGGGSFFGNIGSFKPNYEFDALVIDDSTIGIEDLSLEERLERFIYLGNAEMIKERYVRGIKLSKPSFPSVVL